jgi:hypothetical protein
MHRPLAGGRATPVPVAGRALRISRATLIPEGSAALGFRHPLLELAGEGVQGLRIKPEGFQAGMGEGDVEAGRIRVGRLLTGVHPLHLIRQPSAGKGGRFHLQQQIGGGWMLAVAPAHDSLDVEELKIHGGFQRAHSNASQSRSAAGSSSANKPARSCAFFWMVIAETSGYAQNQTCVRI